MIFPHISRRTRILLMIPPAFLISLVCLGSLVVVIYSAFFYLGELTEVVPFVTKPDVDGKLTFPGPTYRFRVSPTEFSSAWKYSTRDLPFMVHLLLDRRELGALEAPSEQRPLIVCGANGCNYYCLSSRPCENDIGNGWYSVDIFPAFDEYGLSFRPLSLGPVSGTGVRCADAGKAGLELCWDPARTTPSEPLTNVRSVSYPAIEGRESEPWVSTTSDMAGHPTFVTLCVVDRCSGTIERFGARLQITFNSRELDNWQRFDAGLHDFAARLIEPFNLLAGLVSRNSTPLEPPLQPAAIPERRLARMTRSVSPGPAYDPRALAAPLVPSDDANDVGGLLGMLAGKPGIDEQDPTQPARPDDEQEQAKLQALEDRLTRTGSINDAWALYKARIASRR